MTKYFIYSTCLFLADYILFLVAFYATKLIKSKYADTLSPNPKNYYFDPLDSVHMYSTYFDLNMTKYKMAKSQKANTPFYSLQNCDITGKLEIVFLELGYQQIKHIFWSKLISV